VPARPGNQELDVIEKRATFSGRIGFVLAAAASAIGLGNIWRFPYLAAKYGGGMFLLVYIILVLTFGFTLMVAEITLGRKTGLSVIGAYRKLNGAGFCGHTAALSRDNTSLLLRDARGWVVKLAAFASEREPPPRPIPISPPLPAKHGSRAVMLIFLRYIFIVLLGVQKGVEKAAKILMPILIGLMVTIPYIASPSPAREGRHIFHTRPVKIFLELLLAAMDKCFFPCPVHGDNGDNGCI
jgi:NSS family neurotransmitter:Na+ symporter